MFNYIFITIFSILLIRWIIEPLYDKPDYSYLYKDVEDKIKKMNEEYKAKLLLYTYNETIDFSDDCYVNITRTNGYQNDTLSIIMKPIELNYKNCDELKNVVDNNIKLELNEEEILQKYYIYAKNEIELLTLNDTVNVCGGIDFIKNTDDEILNFDINNYEEGRIYNLSFTINNKTLIYKEEYNNNICNNIFLDYN